MRIPGSLARRRLVWGAAAALLSGQAAALPVPSQLPAQVSAGGGQPVISTGSSDVQVDLNAARTIIDWSSFNLNPGEGAEFVFDQRNWIVLNRVSGSAISINGHVRGTHPGSSTPGGKVWFYSPQGVIFGPNALVDVGGLLATSAAPGAAAFLDANNVNIPFTGAGSGGPVTVAAGAQLNATAHVALVAPRVSTEAGSTVTVGDFGTALYGGADSFEIQFFPASNNDLTLFTFIVPNRAAGTPNLQALSIAGQTTSGTIYLAAYSRAQMASELINAPGLLTARSAVREYGQVTITTGRNIILGQVGASNPDDNQVAGVSTGSARVGTIIADGNVNVILPGISVGDLTAERIQAGQGLLIAARNVTIPGGVSAGAANVFAGNAILDVSGVVDIPSIIARTFVSAQRGPIQTGRTPTAPTLRLGDVTAGTSVQMLNVVSITADDVVAGTFASLSSGQGVTLDSMVAGELGRIGSAGPVTVGSLVAGDAQLSASGNITAGLVVGSQAASIGSGAQADVLEVVAPSIFIGAFAVRVGSATASGDVSIRTPSMVLTDSMVAANVTIEGSSGRFRLGGTEEPGLTNDELQRIVVSGALNLYAGQREPNAQNPNPQYGDFEIGDVTVNTDHIPQLNLFAHSDRQVSILGTVTVEGSGGALQIGDATEGGAWLPQRIVISGGLGTAEGDATSGFTDVGAFDLVALNAADDILIGSERFIDLVTDTPAEEIDIGRGLPTGVAAEGDEVGRLFLVAGSAELSAGERIVQQNTGAPGQEGGFYLTGEGVEAGEPLLTITSAGTVDMFGALGSDAGVVFGRQASFSQLIAIGGEEVASFSSSIRINGCPLGVGCAISTPAAQFRVEQFRAATPAAAVDPPLLIPALPPVDEDERENEPVITGTGNEEIWRRQP